MFNLFQTLTSVRLKMSVTGMPHVRIPYDLTIALAEKDLEETEETAQVKSKRCNKGIIATVAYSFVLHALRAC